MTEFLRMLDAPMSALFPIAAQDIRFLSGCLTVAAIMFGLGVAGLVLRRNLFSIFISLAISVQGIILALAAFSTVHETWSGQVFALFLLVFVAVQGCFLLAFASSNAKRPHQDDATSDDSKGATGSKDSIDETPASDVATEVSHD